MVIKYLKQLSLTQTITINNPGRIKSIYFTFERYNIANAVEKSD